MNTSDVGYLNHPGAVHTACAVKHHDRHIISLSEGTGLSAYHLLILSKQASDALPYGCGAICRNANTKSAKPHPSGDGMLGDARSAMINPGSPRSKGPGVKAGVPGAGTPVGNEPMSVAGPGIQLRSGRTLASTRLVECGNVRVPSNRMM